MKIYLDNCCWNRPFDGYTDKQSVDEVTAIKAIIAICKSAGYSIIGSPAVEREIDGMCKRKPEKWGKVRGLYNHTITDSITPTTNMMTRAQGFMTVGIGRYDSIHLAVSEAAGVDVLLTTDNDFINTCAREKLSIVNVINPIFFLPEVQKWAQ